jgi:methanogenic corrinoid protein MtbC1
LYSQRDIETIKWLMKRQEDGLSISRAVDLWNEQMASGTDPLADLLPTKDAASIPVPYKPSETPLDSLRAQWIEACLNFSESAAEQTLNQAFSLFPVEAVCIDVLQKGLSEIGERWYENRASVQQEHFASALAMRRLDTLLSASPAPTRNQTVLVACPPGEWHTFTPLLLALLLRRRGLHVIYLGANVPVDQLTSTVSDTQANLVALVAQQLITAASLQQIAQTLSSQGIPVTFGGRIFNMQTELHTCIPGYFLGPDLTSALDQIDLVLNKKLKLPQPRVISPGYIAARGAFTAKRGQVELTLKETIEQLSLAPNNVRTGVHFLGENITAGLQLGDMSYVSAEVEWLKTLLQFHEAQPEQLIYFMQAYAEAVEKNLDGHGKPILEWFAREIEKLSVG